MLKLVAVVPSWRRPKKLAETLRGIERYVRPDDLIVLEQPDDAPLGSGEARRRVCEEAYRRHGDDCAILSMDDDCKLDERSDPRWAMELFEDPCVGLVQCPNQNRPIKDHQVRKAIVYHVFMIRGKVIGEGINYHPRFYADEVTISLRAWLAGWINIRTQRCRILHHVTSRARRASFGGGREEAFLDGWVPLRSAFYEEFVSTGLVDCPLTTRDGVILPTRYDRIRPTRKAREIHKRALAMRRARLASAE